MTTQYSLRICSIRDYIDYKLDNSRRSSVGIVFTRFGLSQVIFLIPRKLSLIPQIGNKNYYSDFGNSGLSELQNRIISCGNNTKC